MTKLPTSEIKKAMTVTAITTKNRKLAEKIQRKYKRITKMQMNIRLDSEQYEALEKITKIINNTVINDISLALQGRRTDLPNNAGHSISPVQVAKILLEDAIAKFIEEENQ